MRPGLQLAKNKLVKKYLGNLSCKLVILDHREKKSAFYIDSNCRKMDSLRLFDFRFLFCCHKLPSQFISFWNYRFGLLINNWKILLFAAGWRSLDAACLTRQAAAPDLTSVESDTRWRGRSGSTSTSLTGRGPGGASPSPRVLATVRSDLSSDSCAWWPHGGSAMMLT